MIKKITASGKTNVWDQRPSTSTYEVSFISKLSFQGKKLHVDIHEIRNFCQIDIFFYCKSLK